MSTSDPPIIITGGSTNVELSATAFPNLPIRKFTSKETLKRITVLDENGNRVGDIVLPPGRYTLKLTTQ